LRERFSITAIKDLRPFPERTILSVVSMPSKMNGRNPSS
jgi:hypothetical protein